jgi:cytochrome c556
MVDLTQRVPPPMTTDEVALSALMKRISPAFTALGQGVDGSNAEDVIKHATSLEHMFDDLQMFWKTKQRADAEAWATEARRQSRAIEGAVQSSQWSPVRAAIAAIGQQCQSCHAAYRDPFADGSFRIRLVGK